MVTAPDLQAALAIAKGCPHLDPYAAPRGRRTPGLQARLRGHGR